MKKYHDAIKYMPCPHCGQYTFFNIKKKKPYCHRCLKEIQNETK